MNRMREGRKLFWIVVHAETQAKKNPTTRFLGFTHESTEQCSCKKANLIVGCINICIGFKRRRPILTYSPLVRPYLECCIQLQPPHLWKILTTWNVSRREILRFGTYIILRKETCKKIWLLSSSIWRSYHIIENRAELFRFVPEESI